jgi:hypothetical protein
MPWEGSWNANRTAFIGTYTAGATVYMGAWTPVGDLRLSDPPGDPPLSGVLNKSHDRVGYRPIGGH